MGGGIIGVLKDKEGQEQRDDDDNDDDNDESGGGNDKEEFEYTPLYSNHKDKVVVVSINDNDDNLKGNDTTSSTHKLNHSNSTNNDEHAKLPLFYANDGSFLENMKKLNKI